ncbi:MAG TPA: diguanylate cyclase [candidate division Zixibacteria bacterium]
MISQDKGVLLERLSSFNNMFALVRSVLFLGFSIWLSFSYRGSEYNVGMILAFVFLLHLLVFSIISRKTKKHGKLLLFSSIADILFITFLVYFTGGVKSNFYLLYYLSISFTAYYLGLYEGLALSLGSTILYLIIYQEKGSGNIFIGDLAIRILFLWMFAFAVGAISKYLKLSRAKLFRALDTLNERTSELEKSQVQIETIYETSGTLGAIHDLDQVIDETLNIVKEVLGYQMCSVLLLDSRRNVLLLKAKVELGNKIKYSPPEEVPLTGIAGTVARLGKPERVFDIRTDPRYIYGLYNARSELAVPMISQGKVVGVLNAESKRVGAFLEQDEKIFSILASSAGMAIENAMLHQEMEELTIIDELTGIYNYRYFVQKLEDELRRARRYEQILCLIMIDIDCFKRYNDSYGHLFGNSILRGLVQVVKGCIRDVDIFARYGGEEFVVILPQTDKYDAANIGERIRSQVESTQFEGEEKGLKVNLTVSVGIASYPENGTSSEILIQKVDLAMYIAKGRGKNLVCTI